MFHQIALFLPLIVSPMLVAAVSWRKAIRTPHPESFISGIQRLIRKGKAPPYHNAVKSTLGNATSVGDDFNVMGDLKAMDLNPACRTMEREEIEKQPGFDPETVADVACYAPKAGYLDFHQVWQVLLTFFQQQPLLGQQLTKRQANHRSQ